MGSTTSTWNLDDVGRLVQRTMPGSSPIVYGYDAHDNVVSVTQGSGSVAYTYDELDRQTSRLLPNGVGTSYR